MTEPNPLPPELIKVLRIAERVVVLTGAGVSAESGVTTFRDAQTGLCTNYRSEELASSEAYELHSKLVWDWYAWRRDLVTRAEPNAAHVTLLELEGLFPHFTLVTQNVDRLHQRAGSLSVTELHGSLFHYKCLRCDKPADVPEWRNRTDVPKCAYCGGPVRPDIVWFGESLPARNLALAQNAARHCDLFLSIGTSGVVYPAAGLPHLALEKGAFVVDINPNETELSGYVQCSLRGKASEVVPAIVAAASAGR
jgi:NAD-dependent deacetylase